MVQGWTTQKRGGLHHFKAAVSWRAYSMTCQGLGISLYCSVSQDVRVSHYSSVLLHSQMALYQCLTLLNYLPAPSMLPFHCVSPGAVKTLTMHTVVSQTSHMGGAAGASYTLTKQGQGTFKCLALILSV